MLNSIIFMLAAYETTATTLAWLVYDLALNPDIQELLTDTIDAELGEVMMVVK